MFPCTKVEDLATNGLVVVGCSDNIKLFTCLLFTVKIFTNEAIWKIRFWLLFFYLSGRMSVHHTHFSGAEKNEIRGKDWNYESPYLK